MKRRKLPWNIPVQHWTPSEKAELGSIVDHPEGYRECALGAEGAFLGEVLHLAHMDIPQGDLRVVRRIHRLGVSVTLLKLEKDRWKTLYHEEEFTS